MRPPVLAAAFLLAPSLAAAAGMEISPVLVEVGERAPSAIVTVRNGGTAPCRYQVTALAWSEPVQGQPRLEPSDELSAFPPLFQLGPGEERRVRVGATVPPGDSERAWRLFVEELPSAVEASGAGARIRIRTRFAIPVFQAPARAQRSASLSLVAGGRAVQAVVRNAGNVHVRPELTVALLGDDGEKLHEQKILPTLVLAAAERVSEVPIPRELCPRVRRATAVASLPDGTAHAAVALTGGACAP